MATSRNHPSPLLIGRDDVLRLAERRVEEVRGGHGQFLLLAGEAGIGKTRLAGSIRAMAETRGFRLAAGDLDLATCLLRANRPSDAAPVLTEARAHAEMLESRPILARVVELERAVRSRRIAEEPWRPRSVREFEIARLIARGYTNAAIAAELTLSPKTISAHVEHILAKLGVSRRSEIAAWVSRVPAPHPGHEPTSGSWPSRNRRRPPAPWNRGRPRFDRP